MTQSKIKTIVASNIRRYRKHRGMTQAGLAQALRVSPRYASMLERDPRNLSLESLERIATVLHVTTCALTCESSKHSSASKRDAAQLAIELLTQFLNNSEE